MFNNLYEGKTVFVTGHTGFKGSWLVTWLSSLGANVVGYSKDVSSTPSLFEVAKISEKVIDIRGDIKNLQELSAALEEHKPDFVFHLAAQAIVSESYHDPLDTIATNAIGTANLLQVVRSFTHKCVVICITSDKCYDNVEWLWGYRETDHLGGKDVYSSSKAAAELIIHSFVRSFFDADSNVKIGVGRAGNVIGGGDWAKDRIIVDCVKSWSRGVAVDIRAPKATRPWQHVLEPLGGYLRLAQSLDESAQLHGEAFNFGPSRPSDISVDEILSDLFANFTCDNKPHKSHNITGQTSFNEAGLLKLNCDKARSLLAWESVLEYDETVKFISNWYSAYYSDSENMSELTTKQIDLYVAYARKKGLKWALA